MTRPQSVEDLASIVPTRPRWRVRGAGTKPGLLATDGDVLDLSALTGIVEYAPEECTFTARAGTPVSEIERALATHRQHLPFDPPFSAEGATLGGTLAAGLNGSCRYRFGGLRDFLIGATIVDGEGRILRSGGKVVKNAAGFLLHQALIGSCGRLAVLAEATFKVFPASEAHATLRAPTPDVAAAVALLVAMQRARFDLDALDIEPPGTLVVRVGGFAEALEARVAAIAAVAGPDVAITRGDDDAAVWAAARACAWRPDGTTLVRVPLTLPRLVALDAQLSTHGARRRYTVAGNLAWIAWPAPLAALHEILASMGLVGQVVIGEAQRPFIGAIPQSPFEDRLRTVLDPHGRFDTVRGVTHAIS